MLELVGVLVYSQPLLQDSRDHFTKNLTILTAQAGCSLDDGANFEAEIGSDVPADRLTVAEPSSFTTVQD